MFLEGNLQLDLVPIDGGHPFGNRNSQSAEKRGRAEVLPADLQGDSWPLQLVLPGKLRAPARCGARLLRYRLPVH